MLPVSQTLAQLVGEDAFLQGTYVEVGVNGCGAYGSGESAALVPGPLGPYHPSVFGSGSDYLFLSFVSDSDMDGWSTGTPNLCGDYTIPGSPVEGWGIQIGLDSPLINTDEYCFPQDILGGLVAYTASGSLNSVTWVGKAFSLNGDSVLIKQTTILPSDKLYFTTEVSFYNLGADTIFDLYYLRNLDPDNDQVTTGDYTTFNSIELQPPTDSAALVTAEGLIHGCYLGLGSLDPQARVSYGSFNTRYPSDVWNGVTPYYQTGSNEADEAISLAIKRDKIPPGESTAMAFVYFFSPAVAEEALNTTNFVSIFANDELVPSGGAYLICAGETVDIAVSSSENYSWSWTPSTSLDTDTGPLVIASPTTTTTYHFTGTSPTGETYLDSLTIVVNALPIVDAGPDLTIYSFFGDTAFVTASGLAGASYSWSPTADIIGSDSTATIAVLPSETTTYYLAVVDSNGCSNVDSMVVTVVTEPTGIVDKNLTDLQLSPNPIEAGGSLRLYGLADFGKATFSLLDLSGQLAYQEVFVGEAVSSIRLPATLAGGVYFVSLYSIEQQIHLRGRLAEFE